MDLGIFSVVFLVVLCTSGAAEQSSGQSEPSGSGQSKPSGPGQSEPGQSEPSGPGQSEPSGPVQSEPSGQSIEAANGTDFEEPENTVPFHAALTGYLYWMQRVARIFPRQPVDSTNMHAIEEEGEEVHKMLIAAINKGGKTLGIVLNRDKLATSVLKTLEKDMKVDTQTLLGMVLAHSQTGSQSARIMVSVALFTKMTGKMEKLHRDFRHNDARYLKKVFKIMTVSEIALDTMVESFKFVENLEFGELSHHRYKRSCAGGGSGGTVGGPRPTPIGGGFSRQGTTLIYQNGGTTVTAQPHFNIFPKPEITGGTATLEHRFDSFPGTLTGHVNVNGRGEVQNAGLNLEIKLP